MRIMYLQSYAVVEQNTSQPIMTSFNSAQQNEKRFKIPEKWEDTSKWKTEKNIKIFENLTFFWCFKLSVFSPLIRKIRKYFIFKNFCFVQTELEMSFEKLETLILVSNFLIKDSKTRRLNQAIIISQFCSELGWKLLRFERKIQKLFISQRGLFIKNVMLLGWDSKEAHDMTWHSTQAFLSGSWKFDVFYGQPQITLISTIHLKASKKKATFYSAKASCG